MSKTIWDVHHHLISEAGYVERLLREMDRLGIERAGLMPIDPICPGMWVVHGEPTGYQDNDAIARIVRERPDRFWGYGFARPGHATPEDIDRIVELGLTALKFHLPLKPYGAPEYFDLYARAESHRLPCLFHTGIFYPPVRMPGRGIRSENCRPIHLEPIAYEFPMLTLIAAHLGVCWTEECATLCRIVPNIHADLSGSLGGWRSNKSLEWFKQTLYWPGAHTKVLFGSDVHADEVGKTLADQARIVSGMDWSAQQQEDFFHGNARRIFGKAKK